MLDGRKSNLNQKWNSNKCWCECKSLKKYVCKKDYTWNSAPCSCENGKYLESFFNNSVIMSDKLIDAAAASCDYTRKTVPTITVNITCSNEFLYLNRIFIKLL